MRTNLTKKEIVNSIYMKLGLSKRILDIVLDRLRSLQTMSLDIIQKSCTTIIPI